MQGHLGRAASAFLVAVALASAPPPARAQSAAGDTQAPVRDASPAKEPLSVVPGDNGALVVLNARLVLGPATYRIGRAVLSGANLSAAELRELLDPASPRPALDRVTRLSAASVTIPEIVAEVQAGDLRKVATYRDVTLTGLDSGRIARTVSAGGTFETSGAGAAGRGGFAGMSIEALDLPVLLSLVSAPNPAAPQPAAEPRRILAGWTMDGFAARDEQGRTSRIERLSLHELTGRPTPEGWFGTVSRLGAVPAPDVGSPAERRQAYDLLLQLVDAAEIGGLEASGIELPGQGPDAEPSRLAHLAYAAAPAHAAAPGAPGSLKLDGLEAGGRGVGTLKIASAVFAGTSARAMLTALRDMEGGPAAGGSPVAFGRLVAALGSARLSGLAVEAPSGAAADLPRVTAEAVEWGAEKPVDGIPTDLRFSARNVAFPLPADPSNDALQRLKALGYGTVRGSWTTRLGWNEPGQELLLRDLSVEADEMGSVALSGVLGQVSKDVLNPDRAVSSVALIGATVKSLHLELENRGLFGRILDREATRQSRPAEDIRREWGMAAAVGIPVMLGASPAARTLAQAVARFVAKPGRLVVDTRARNSAGLGAADFAANPDPRAILGQVDLTATAE